MAKETAVQGTGAAAPQAAKKKSGKGLLIVGLTFLLMAAGVGAAWYLRHSKTEANATPPKTDTAPAAIIHLESFIVNLADTDQITYLRVSIDLGVGKPPAKKEGDSLPTAPIRDAILGVLATRKSAELLTPDGKLKLKQDLLAALKSKVPDLDAREIYFTDFLVQR
jgi:flagellar protein FliL